MKKYVVLEKKRGETPLEALTAWRLMNPQYLSTPASYAGRLDPMASGTLLVLLGDECKRQKEYTKLDKEYVIEVVLDLSTDTGDALGIPSYDSRESAVSDETIRSALHSVMGTHTVAYPAFSSKTVAGKPLFLYALEGTLDTIQIPTHEETIYAIRLLTHEVCSRESLRTRINRTLSVVPTSDEPSKVLGADFRQNEIRAAWDTLFTSLPKRTFTILTLKVTCASGTYMRTLASRLAKELGATGFALSIHRTKIGRATPLPSRPLWLRMFT